MAQKKIKIAFLSRYLNQVHRGAETYVLELSKRLANKFDIEILSGTESDDLSKIISGKYDLVIPTNGRWQAFKASLGRMAGNYKLLVSGQAGIGKDDLWNIIFCLPDFYVAITEYEKSWAKKFAWRTKVVKINNGVDLEKFSLNGKRINFNLPGPIILAVGALEWYKHHELVIEAVAKLKKGSLVIVGSGSQFEKLTRLGNEKLIGRFKIVSYNFKDMPSVYRSADVFTLPSWDRESFGIVYVEAMASGLPIVAPDDPPRQEIVDGAGVLTEVNDINKYTVALEEALDKNWGQLPRQQAEKFSWDKIAGDYEKLIEEMFK